MQDEKRPPLTTVCLRPWALFWSVVAGTFAAGVIYDFGKALVMGILQ